MPRKFKLAYFAHTLRSDWNNGNAHFLRGLMRSLGELGHEVTIFEPEDDWSISNLRDEPSGAASLQQFSDTYPDLNITTYSATQRDSAAFWISTLHDTEIVILHEWNTPQLAQHLLDAREQLRFRLLFHDTHHRASSSPEQISLFGIHRFDGVLAFGEALRSIYRERFRLPHVWTLHEAADTSVFHPMPSAIKDTDTVWIGNWGEGERSHEISEYLLSPAAQLREFQHVIYGVRYPADGLAALARAGVQYRGYLPNLAAPAVYSRARLTVHIPRQQYSGAMAGIPTIRVFEALACGIPLISAPWQDSESLFREGDFLWARNCAEMKAGMQHLLTNPALAQAQAARGLETIQARHTCKHRAEQLTSIFEELSK